MNDYEGILLMGCICSDFRCQCCIWGGTCPKDPHDCGEPFPDDYQDWDDEDERENG